MSNWILLLAQAGNGEAPAEPEGPGMFMQLVIPMALIFIVVMWMSSSGRKKEKKKRDDMLTALKKHDRVMTIGGIIGTVMDVRDGEVTLKVDEGNNTRMRFSQTAIQKVVSDDPEPDTK